MNSSKLERFFQNRANAEERIEVIDWLLDAKNDDEIRFWLKRNWEQVQGFSTDDTDADPDVERIWEKIRSNIDTSVVLEDAYEAQVPPHRTLFMTHWKKLAVASALVGIFFSVSYLFFIIDSANNQSTKTTVQQLPVQDVAPPKDSKAVLTLADGTRIYLDSEENGVLATQGEVVVQQNEGGEIVYVGEAGVVAYNTLSNPRGSKPIRLVLSDGSIVWLNAASSITYPTAFSGKERRVRMTGEAYFEITSIRNIPFFVEQGNVRIHVLGTHFNVNADEDEGSARITLLEGSVRVSTEFKNVQIQPGQQVQTTAKRLDVVDDIDLEEVMSWKNGQFFFTGTDIRMIMKQVEKYYDIEVEYRDEIPYQFVAKISRDVNISAFLEKLELTNLIHFKIEGKKIIVMK